MSNEYDCVAALSDKYPDASAWEERLLEFGLHREAFNIAPSSDSRLRIKFWEYDRVEALRILAKLSDTEFAGSAGGH